MLETKIDELIVAINRLTEALNAREGATCCNDSDVVTPEEQKLSHMLDTLTAKKPRKKKEAAAAPAPEAETVNEAGAVVISYTPPAPAPTPAPAPAPKAEAPKVTIDDIRNAAQKLLDEGKPERVRKVTREFSVSRISEIAPEKYADVLARLTEEEATDGTV